MNKTLCTLTLFATIASLSGCGVMHREPIRPVKMEKGSAVDLRTQLDAADLVWNSMQRLGCRQTDVIYPEVLEKTPDLRLAKDMSSKGRSQNDGWHMVVI